MSAHACECACVCVHVYANPNTHLLDEVLVGVVAQVGAQLQEHLPSHSFITMEVAQQQDGGGAAVCMMGAQAKHPQVLASS